MSESVMFLLFLAMLVIAARICLRGDRRKPILPDDDAMGNSSKPRRLKGA